MASRLAEMQARFQQKQMQEREEKLLRLYESQQQRAFERVSRGSAGSNSSTTSTSTSTGGKVRQMFDERRQKAGIDRSYPLEPINKGSKSNGVCKPNGIKQIQNKAVIRTVVKSSAEKKNGDTLINKSAFMETVYNNNGNEQIYREQIYEKDNRNNDFMNSASDLVDMMNNHNLNDSLDNEVPPHFDEPDHVLFSGKLANLGGKLPSEIGISNSKRSVPYTTTITAKTTPVAKKETKPIIKKTVVRTTPSTKSSANNLSLSQQSLKPSISKTTPQAMNKVPTAKAPSAARPSAKQTPKSAVTRDDLESCKYCNRRFVGDRLQVHENICSKTGKKKRKTYDATKHRVQGTELEQYVRKGKTTSSSKSAKSVSSKANNWRKKHEEFIAAIKAAKMAQAHIAKGGKLSDLPPPPPSSNPDYIQCPHCGRRFNETAAERHIPKCATFLHNKPKPGVTKTPGKR